ncbi:MAG: hypothetical protein Q6365_016700 [Candidatus Sigynarchaeota archaeon]
MLITYTMLVKTTQQVHVKFCEKILDFIKAKYSWQGLSAVTERIVLQKQAIRQLKILIVEDVVFFKQATVIPVFNIDRVIFTQRTLVDRAKKISQSRIKFIIRIYRVFFGVLEHVFQGIMRKEPERMIG